MAKSKIELILEMKDRMTKGLHKAKDAVSTCLTTNSPYLW